MTAASDYKENSIQCPKTGRNTLKACTLIPIMRKGTRLLQPTNAYLEAPFVFASASLITDAEQFVGGTNKQPAIGNRD